MVLYVIINIDSRFFDFLDVDVVALDFRLVGQVVKELVKTLLIRKLHVAFL